MEKQERQRVTEALDAAVRWLLGSGVRASDGGVRSVYYPATATYTTYGGGRSCLQCTAGAVLALLAAARVPGGSGPGAGECLTAAVESAGHILRIVRSRPGPGEGAIPCGLEAGTVKTLHTEAALRAFVAVHEVTGDPQWLEGARIAAHWAVRNLQRSDGSFRSGAASTSYGRLRRRILDVSPIGAAAYVRTLRRLARLTGERTFDAAALRLFEWLRRQEDGDGGFPMYRYRTLTRPVSSFFHGGAIELWRGCLRYHPSPNAWMLEAFLTEGDEEGARRVSAWFLPRLSPNGLLYQFYFADRVGPAARGRGVLTAGGIVAAPYGARSVEEDVMPTASLALQWLSRPSIFPAGNPEKLLAKITSGILYAQVRDADARIDGGVRGLPLHPAFGENIYAWDTAYAVLYLGACLASGRG
jgi:hypothetical protein